MSVAAGAVVAVQVRAEVVQAVLPVAPIATMDLVLVVMTAVLQTVAMPAATPAKTTAVMKIH